MGSRIFDSLGDFFGFGDKPVSKPAEETLVTDEGVVFKVEQVKRGGMGIVYICRMESDEKEKRLALKTFDEKYFFNVEMSSVLSRETAIWTQLSDVPFVVPLISIVSVDKKPYLMMLAAEPNEKGIVSLGDAVRNAPAGLSFDECIAAALCIAITMTKAAQRIPNVVHGDIKPDNVLYFAQRPFLSDFGLAGLAHERGGRGTPAYMAPELWRENGYQTVQSDIYAFGAMLFELLVGHPPFENASGDRLTWSRLHASEPVPVAGRSGLDSALGQQLKTLTLHCLAKDAADRPTDFKAVVGSLLECGLAWAPAPTADIMRAAAHFAQLANHPLLTSSRIRSLLRQGEIGAAVQMLQQLSENELQGELLMMAGSTWSLAGDDSKALDYFHRFLATNPDDDARLLCSNEIGLSLRRLGRFDEAKVLFEQLLEQTVGKRELHFMVRGNYAGVLLDMNDVESARRELEWLVRHNDKAPQAHALYASALERSGQLPKALEMIQRAVALDPRNGQYHVTRGNILLRLGRVPDALQAADAAYNLGYHTRDWLTLALTTNMALNNGAEVAGLLKAMKGKLPEATLDAITADVLEGLRSLLKDSSDGAATPTAVSTANKSETFGTAPPDSDSKPDSVPPQATEESSGTQRSEEEFREAIRAGKASHMQLRMSYVDHSFTCDFYSDVNSSDYVRDFRAAYAPAKSRLETTMHIDEREARYRFAECQHCKFIVLTARDEDERFLCQACGEKGPVVSKVSPRLQQLAEECERAIGRSIQRSPRGIQLVAFWIEGEKAEILAQLMLEASYVRAPSDVGAFTFFAALMSERQGSLWAPPTQVWHRPVTSEDSAFGDQTPHSVDRLLRSLRREIGAITSMSTQADGLMRDLMLSDVATLLEILRAQVDQNPDDPELKGNLVTTALMAGQIEEAERIAIAMETTAPDDMSSLQAAAEVAMAKGRPENAAPRLERILAAEPRNQTARALVIRAHIALQNSEQTQKHMREYQSLGGILPQHGETEARSARIDPETPDRRP